MSDATLPETASIAVQLARVQARIAAAVVAAGRPADCVQLVAVSKTYPASDVLQALHTGQRHFGENRVQEAAQKFPALRDTYPGIRLHIIGGLQTNKAADAVRVADVIETLDRPKLLDALSLAADRGGRCPELLVQVNVGDESQKAGVSRADADGFIRICVARMGGRVTGLMCIPPAADDPGPHFAWLASCAAHHGLLELSMGMSADFEAAIQYGATHVRVGSAIFGARVPPL